ncbi:MAG: arginase family protein [Bacteroidia bacterium]|nr:arginase family protein [Bacteroidia bacterium]MDW8334816.1 arginase family protein [Bacteroidia bacterium]
MNIAEYFETASLAPLREGCGAQQIGGGMWDADAEFPRWEEADLLIVGFPENRTLPAHPVSLPAPNEIRKHLYRLAAPFLPFSVADLGNLILGEDPQESLHLLGAALNPIFKRDKTVLLLGGTQEATVGICLGMAEGENPVRYVGVDARTDLFGPLPPDGFHYDLLARLSFPLAHFALVGLQQHYITHDEREALGRINAETVRLGMIQADVRQAEPPFRLAHVVSFDLSVVRWADAPGVRTPSPTGLTVEQACQIARFAGMGYDVRAFVLCELLPPLDPDGRTAHVAALIAWYFIEGHFHKPADRPAADRQNLVKYVVAMSGPIKEVVFYKNPQTDRWWMEVPAFSSGDRVRTKLVPCTERDYQTAMRDEAPDKWWREYGAL